MARRAELGPGWTLQHPGSARQPSSSDSEPGEALPAHSARPLAAWHLLRKGDAAALAGEVRCPALRSLLLIHTQADWASHVLQAPEIGRQPSAFAACPSPVGGQAAQQQTGVGLAADPLQPGQPGGAAGADVDAVFALAACELGVRDSVLQRARRRLRALSGT